MPIFTDEHIATRINTLVSIVVPPVRFELTQPEDIWFTVKPSSPTLACGQTMYNHENTNTYRLPTFFMHKSNHFLQRYKSILVKICNL